MLKVTSVRIELAERADSKLKAKATVEINNAFAIKDIRIVEGNSGLFVAMPSRKNNDGKYYDIVDIFSNDFKKELSNAILKVMKKRMCSL